MVLSKIGSGMLLMILLVVNLVSCGMVDVLVIKRSNANKYHVNVNEKKIRINELKKPFDSISQKKLLISNLGIQLKDIQKKFISLNTYLFADIINAKYENFNRQYLESWNENVDDCIY